MFTFVLFLEWYYGYNTRNRREIGIFPKAYVRIKEAIISKTGFVLYFYNSFMFTCHKIYLKKKTFKPSCPTHAEVFLYVIYEQ